MKINRDNEVTVRVLKYDGTEYRRWQARVARRADSLLVLDAEFESDVQHDLLGDIRSGSRTIEYYWFDRWYNIFRFLEHDGSTRLWYCNINTPPKLEDSVLTYIDLDIDIVVRSDFSNEVLDVDEFKANIERLEYSEATQRHARQALEELLSMIESRQFPFAEDPFRSVASSVV